MLRSTRSRRLLRAALIASRLRRRARDLLLGQQEMQFSTPSRRGPPDLWKRCGSALPASRAALLPPAVELGTAEPQSAAGPVLRERDDPRGSELVQRGDADPKVVGGFTYVEPAVHICGRVL